MNDKASFIVTLFVPIIALSGCWYFNSRKPDASPESATSSPSMSASAVIVDSDGRCIVVEDYSASWFWADSGFVECKVSDVAFNKATDVGWFKDRPRVKSGSESAFITTGNGIVICIESYGEPMALVVEEGYPIWKPISVTKSGVPSTLDRPIAFLSKPAVEVADEDWVEGGDWDDLYERY